MTTEEIMNFAKKEKFFGNKENKILDSIIEKNSVEVKNNFFDYYNSNKGEINKMTTEEAQKVLDEMQSVRPELLNDEAKRLFEAIMTIVDERDEAKKENELAKQTLKEQCDIADERNQLLKENAFLKGKVAALKVLVEKLKKGEV